MTHPTLTGCVQGGYFLGILRYNLPQNIVGSHEMFQEILAFVVAFGALREFHYFLTGNSFLQQEFSTSDRKSTSCEMKCVPILTEILLVIINIFMWQEISYVTRNAFLYFDNSSRDIKFFPVTVISFLWQEVHFCTKYVSNFYKIDSYTEIFLPARESFFL